MSTISELERPVVQEPLRRGWLRKAGYLILILLTLLLLGELYARYGLGLGQPPLSMADPQMEYLFQPNQDCRRFGNHITYNQWSMRATPNVSPVKTDLGQFRVLLVGDSLINGGALTDDANLASTLLRDELATQTQQPVFVGNISAGSWGPANQLAYLRKFGCFDADAIVFVWGSDDYMDVPTYEPVVDVKPEFPSARPWLAVSEGFHRYLLPRLGWGRAPASPAAIQLNEEQIHIGAQAAIGVIQYARDSGAQVYVLLWRVQSELNQPPKSGYAELKAIAEAHGATWIDSGDFINLPDPGELFRDVGHPTDQGQHLIAEMLLPRLMEEAKSP